MNKLFYCLVLASLAVLPGGTVFAADLEPPPPPEELRGPAYDWTGIYIGGWIGATCIDGELTENGPDDDWEMSGCGLKGGVLAGYNYQFENWVVGLEGDWGVTDDIATNEESGGDFAFSMDHIATLRARFGFAFDDTLIFVTGGGAWAKGDLNGIIAATPDHINGDHWGWTIGGGVEQAFSEHFRMKLDYLYTKFDGDDYVDGCCDLTVHDFDDHEVRLGAIFAF